MRRCVGNCMRRLVKPSLPAGIGQTYQKSQPTPEQRRRQNRLIFVDDDHLYRSIVKAELEAEGFFVVDFAKGEEMLAVLRAGADADIVLLDWRMGSIGGLDLLALIREFNADLPVVFLSDQGTPVHERLAFERGAAEFIDKSRGTEILAARLRLIVRNERQLPMADQVVFQRGRLMLKPKEGRAYWRGVDVNLTVSEFRVVHALALQAGKFVPYRQIYDAMHYEGFMAGSGDDGYRANVRSAIKRIRIKFLECDRSFDEIKNYNGFGYCWE